MDSKESASEQPLGSIDFVTLGMFIIDEIEFLPPKPPVKDVLGGAGTFSALGARLFSPPPTSHSVGWIVDRGSDFPDPLNQLIAAWDTSVLLRDDPDRLTTRGWNGYDEHQNRAFRYTTPKQRLTADDLTPELLASRSFHLICSPTRCQSLVREIKSRRHDLTLPDGTHPHLPKPIFIWEPVPDLCTPDELLNCTNTLPLVDICSPNHTELAGFMGDTGHDPETGEIDTRQIERACEQLLSSMPLQSYSLVVRAGDKGCYLARNGGRRKRSKTTSHPSSSALSPLPAKRPKKPSALLHGSLQPDTDMEALFAGLLQDEDGAVAREEIEVDPGVERWVPAYHQDAEKVVDPTGGGNTFLGGLAVALARGKSLEEAAAWGSVAASFAIEQVGLPEMTVIGGVEVDGVESQDEVTGENAEGQDDEPDTQQPQQPDLGDGAEAQEAENQEEEIVEEQPPMPPNEDVVTEAGIEQEGGQQPIEATARRKSLVAAPREELWNGVSVNERFEEFKTRLAFR